jgi:cytochrome c peroxidase
MSLLRFVVVFLVACTAAIQAVHGGQPRAELRANPALPAVVVPPDNPQTPEKVALGRPAVLRPAALGRRDDQLRNLPRSGDAWANHNRSIPASEAGREPGTRAPCSTPPTWISSSGTAARAASRSRPSGRSTTPSRWGRRSSVVRKLNAVEGYRTQFQAVFGTDATPDGIAKAIAAFERTVLSGPSPFDRYMAGDKTAMSASAIRGLRVFNGKARCRTCHKGPMLSDQGFHNLGVGMDRPQPDIGRQAVTNDPRDRGAFKTPTLRNVALTAPTSTTARPARWRR